MNINNQKGFTNIVLIVLIMILAGTVGYFMLVKKSPTPTNETQTTNDLSSQQTPPVNTTKTPPPSSQTNNPGWKTFSNRQYGISISFPNMFITDDGIDDFLHLCSGCGGSPQNAEYFYFCDGIYMPPTGKVCSGPFSYFGIQLHDYVVTQALIDSWGGEVAHSQRTTINGRPAWVVKMCAGSGCSVSIMFNHSGDTLSVAFYNNLYIDNVGPLFVSELAKEILATLQF